MHRHLLLRGLAITLGAWLLIQASGTYLGERFDGADLSGLTLMAGLTTLIHLAALAAALRMQTHIAACAVFGLPGALALLSLRMSGLAP